MSNRSWQPVAGPSLARQRAAMLARVREYFTAEDILEVETPMLSRAAVSDPNVASIPARLSMYPGQTAFLHPSPEYGMKRLLAAGFPDIGSICRVFRDGESGQRHQPEFTMLEWYRLGFDLEDIIADSLELIASVLERSGWSAAAVRMSYRDACRTHAGIDPFDASIGEIADTLEADAGLIRSLGDDRDAWLDLLLATHVAPRFDPERLTCIDHYPASQAALARLCPADSTVADRFEVFLGDLELANGYVELTDAAELRRRFDAEQTRRENAGHPVAPLDEALLASLEAGLPRCAGVAVGFDRLVMVATATDDIRAVLHFPHGAEQ